MVNSFADAHANLAEPLRSHEVVLTRLLARTAHFALDPDQPPTRVHSLMVRRFSALPLPAKASRDT